MFVMEKAPKSIDAEAYRSLRSNIEYSSFDDEYRVIVVTSSVPGEGKSTTSGNLAIALAESGNSVLLVDCDMRKPARHKKFKISNAAGTAELLLRKKSFEEVANKHNENLTIITAGKIPPNPSEMLGSMKLSRLNCISGLFERPILSLKAFHKIAALPSWSEIST